MALRNIVTVGDPILTKKCRPVLFFDAKLHTLLDDMADTLLEANGVGLAAPQVGILRRVVIIDTGDENGIVELVNPKLLETSGEQTGTEGCLSVPDEYGVVTRPMVAKVRAQDRYGDWFEMEGEELIARAICHELDHLEGRLYTEIAERMLTPEELQELAQEQEEA